MIYVILSFFALAFIILFLWSKLKIQEAKMEFLKEMKQTLGETSFESLQKLHTQSQGEFEKKEIAIAKLVQPVQDSLLRLDDGLRKLEKERKGEQEVLKEQMRAMIESEKHLRQETANLVSALRKPEIRGMWGEVQLKRVIELAGMLNYCDFFEQQVLQTEEGRLRPDVVVRLPSEKSVIIDAKAPFEAFLDANQTKDDHVRLERLQDHAKHIRMHITQLGRKTYWNFLEGSPEFVVLFLPAEIFFSSALQQDPSLIEFAAEQGVVIATPTTLIGLLRAIAYGWKQDQFSKNAHEISQLGKELHKRVYDMTKHFATLGKSLASSVDAYNKAMGTLEKRVLVSARKFKEYGAAADSIEIDEPELLDQIPKDLV
ncbi:MAG: DNA recombination protein RmuC [Chlamydiae bacterium]|nr:DNA recombination protein RmuC [Chlamydiota bacterium]